VIVFILFLCANPTTQQTNCEPVNVGLIAAIPWDISNTLRAPIGGPLSLALSVVMALILLFGFLLAPVNYILGYPSRIYHPARRPGLISDLLYSEDGKKPLTELTAVVTAITNRTAENMYRDDNDASESRKFSPDHGTTRRLISDDARAIETNSFPDFLSSAFFLIPENNTECQKLILCHAHGFLKIFPAKFTKLIRFFSKRLASIPEEYQSAVVLGLNNQAECKNYFKCSKNISILLKDVLYSLLSSEIKEFWKLQKLF